MNLVYAIGIILVVAAVVVFYYVYNIDTYIVRVNKKRVMEFKSSMDLTGLPIVTFYQGNRKYHFLLDTGSNVSYVNSKSDIEVIKTVAKDTFMGANGQDMPCEVATIKLYRDGVEYDCTVSVADLNAAFTELKDTYGVLISGLLGNNFFVKYQYCLDFKELVAYSRTKK